MKDKNIKLNIRFELAIEIILFCIIFILFGIAFLFASNLLSFNWVSAISILLALYLIYLKASSTIELKESTMTIKYLKYFNKKTIEVETIDKIIFYEGNHLVEIETKMQETIPFYLTHRNKEKLLRFVVQNCPETPCLVYNRTDETAR